MTTVKATPTFQDIRLNEVDTIASCINRFASRSLGRAERHNIQRSPEYHRRLLYQRLNRIDYPQFARLDDAQLCIELLQLCKVSDLTYAYQRCVCSWFIDNDVWVHRFGMLPRIKSHATFHTQLTALVNEFASTDATVEVIKSTISEYVSKRYVMSMIEPDTTLDPNLNLHDLSALVSSRLQVPSPPRTYFKPTPYTQTEAYKNKVQVKADNRLFGTIKRENEILKHENTALKRMLHKRVRSSSPVPTLKVTRVTNAQRQLDRIKRITNLDYTELNPEAQLFINTHLTPMKSIKLSRKPKAIVLFPPMNEDEFFKKLDNVQHRYEIGSTTVGESNLVYTLYYLNGLDCVEDIYKFIDEVYRQTKGKCKFTCDVGMIVETRNNSPKLYEPGYSYHELTPREAESNRSIPHLITRREDLESYKTYVYAYINEHMERTHMDSNSKYVAIHRFMIKVARVAPTGVMHHLPGTYTLQNPGIYKSLVHHNGVHFKDLRKGNNNACLYEGVMLLNLALERIAS